MTEYGMVIDLRKCVRCRTCYVACKMSHGIPIGTHGKIRAQEYRRLWFLEFEYGHYPKVRRAFVPILCMHCSEPACKDTCPTEAIYIDDKGAIRTDSSKCTLCLKCVFACPYEGRVYWSDLGIINSCDFCVDRNYKPYCSERCPGDAFYFGNLSDPQSEVSKFVGEGLAKPITVEGYDTKPKVYYISPYGKDLEESAENLKSRIQRRKNK